MLSSNYPHLEGFRRSAGVKRRYLCCDLKLSNNCYGLTKSIKTPPISHTTAQSRYGRVFCNGQNIIKQIVEDRDSTPNKITTSMLGSIPLADLALCCHYFRQIIPARCSKPAEISDGCDVEDYQEIPVSMTGNSWQRHTKFFAKAWSEWMTAGVTLISITIDDTVQLQPDVLLNRKPIYAEIR